MSGEYLSPCAWRSAFWTLVLHENPIELEFRAKETFYGPYESEIKKEDDGNES